MISTIHREIDYINTNGVNKWLMDTLHDTRLDIIAALYYKCKLPAYMLTDIRELRKICYRVGYEHKTPFIILLLEGRRSAMLAVEGYCIELMD
jgi:hypothetical protein